jgi:hypothetical protein
MSFNSLEKQNLVRKLGNMTWYFTPEAIAAFQDVGVPIPRGLTSFILKILSMKVIQDGAIQVAIMGLSLEIRKSKYDIFVDLLEDGIS